jgi:DNA-binding LacI/PurR family transcriptional regulator
MVSPRLATYRQNTEMIARTAVQLLADAIDHPQEHIPQRVALAGTFIPGETLGPAYIRA